VGEWFRNAIGRPLPSPQSGEPRTFIYASEGFFGKQTPLPFCPVLSSLSVATSTHPPTPKVHSTVSETWDTTLYGVRATSCTVTKTSWIPLLCIFIRH